MFSNERRLTSDCHYTNKIYSSSIDFSLVPTQSKNDDLGQHNLTSESKFIWTFMINLWGTTHFRASMNALSLMCFGWGKGIYVA